MHDCGRLNFTHTNIAHCSRFQKRNRSNHFPSLWSLAQSRKKKRVYSFCSLGVHCFLLVFHHSHHRHMIAGLLASFCSFDSFCMSSKHQNGNNFAYAQRTQPKHFWVHTKMVNVFIRVFFCTVAVLRKSGFRMVKKKWQSVQNMHIF